MGKCRNCKFGEKVTDEQKKYALKVQAIRAKPILNSIKIKEIAALTKVVLEDLIKYKHLIGLEDLTYNNLPVDIQGVDIYRICMNDKNKQVIPGFKEFGRNIHKTYFACEHWEAE